MSARPWVLAIDFGTSFTVAAVAREGSSPEAIEVDGERRVPSVFHVDSTGRLIVGRVAEELSGSNPASTVRAPKNRLGDQAPVIIGGRTWPIVGLVAQLLASIYRAALTQMGTPPTEVVLTHPATWNTPRANRLLDAAGQAQLPHPKLVPEPVAAAWSYVADSGVDPGAFVAVYDLGGGTFDTAVVTPDNDGFTIVGRPSGDASIGGELFDELVVNHLGARLDADAWEAIQLGEDPGWHRVGSTLRNEARRSKEVLSAHDHADILLPLPTGMRQLQISRDELEQLIAPYVQETAKLLGRCISDAGITPAQLAAISLVGGASRSPIVERTVSEAFPGVRVSRRGDPKTAVALGALRANTAGAVPTMEEIEARDRTRVTGPPTNEVVPPVPNPVVAPASSPIATPVTSAPPPPPAPSGSTPVTQPRRRWPLIAGAAAVAAAIAVGAILATSGGNGNRRAGATTTAPATTAAAAAATLPAGAPPPTAPATPATSATSGSASASQAQVDGVLLTADEASSATGISFTVGAAAPLRSLCNLRFDDVNESKVVFAHGALGPGHLQITERIDTFRAQVGPVNALQKVVDVPQSCPTDTSNHNGVSYTVANSAMALSSTFGSASTGLLSAEKPTKVTLPTIYTVFVAAQLDTSLVLTSFTTTGAPATPSELGALAAFTTHAVTKARSLG